MSENDKPSGPLSASRRDVLAGMGSIAGAAGLPNFPSPAEIATLIAEPRKGMIAILGLAGKLTDANTNEIHVARMLSTLKPPENGSEVARFFNSLMFRNIPEHIMARANAMPRENSEEYLQILRWTFSTDWMDIGKIAANFGAESDDANWRNMMALRNGIDQTDPEIIRARQSSSPLETYKLLDNAQLALGRYRERFTLYRDLEAAIRKDPLTFAKELRQLNVDYPYTFTQGLLRDGLNLIDQMRKAPIALPDPDVLQEKLMESYCRLIGYPAPPELSEAAQQRVQRALDDPNYEPYLSKEAEEKRQIEAARRAAQEAPITVTRTMEARPVYAFGEYREPAMEVEVPVYYVTAESNESFARISAMINKKFPLNPLITENYRFDHGYHALKKPGTLCIVNPPPELAAWVESLRTPETRVNAIERLNQLGSQGVGRE